MCPQGYSPPPSPGFTNEQLAEILFNVSSGANKQPHELRGNQFVNFRDYKRSVANFKAFKRRNIPIEAFTSSPWDTLIVPVGAWRWNRGADNGDISVAQLVQVPSDSPHVRTIGNPVNNDFVISRELMAKSFCALIEEGIEFPPLEGYGFGNDIYIMDGHRRLAGAKYAGADVRIWVERVGEDSRTITRTEFLRQAIEANLTVPADVLAEYQAEGVFGSEAAERRFLFTYREKRRFEFPSIGDQLDALYKARQGDSTAITALDALVAQVKLKYQKPQS
jgi:hypothetical protein